MMRRSNSQYITPLYNGKVAGLDDYRTFWINYKHDEVSVGFGSVPMRNILNAYRADSLQQFFNWTSLEEGKPKLSGLKYVAFAADEEWVHFKDIKIGRGVTIRGTAEAPPVTSPSNFYTSFNFPRQFEVSSKHFVVEFEAQGLGDIQLGFITKKRFRMEDPKAYEIILEDAYERRYTKPRSLIQFGTGHGARHLAKTDRYGLVSASTFRPFWVSLVDGVIAVGEGRTVGEQVLMQTTGDLPEPGVDTLWLSTCSYFFGHSIRILAVQSKSDKIDVDYRVADEWKPDTTDVVPITLDTGVSNVYPPFYASATCFGDFACTDPGLPYKREMPSVPARNQWWFLGAYCGENAIQAVAMHWGAYLSQKQIRLVAPDNNNPVFYKTRQNGFEVAHSNMEGTLYNLGLEWNAWDTENEKLPQGPKYLRWVKKMLAKGYPLIWMVRYYEGEMYDHIESVWSIQSERPLTDRTAYNTDVISNNLGVGLKRFYRTFDSLIDTNKIPTGYDKSGNNCTLTTQECLFNDWNWGFAVKGIKDPLKRSIHTSVNVNDNGFEPPPPFVMPTQATVTVQGPLKVGKAYRIFRFDGPGSMPTDSHFEKGKYTSTHDFTATQSTYTWVDPQEFQSNTAVYYVTVAARSHSHHSAKKQHITQTVVSAEASQ